MRQRSLALLACFFLLTALTPHADAQPKGKKQKATSATQKNVAPVIREQTIYIPFEKLKDVFEKRGRGVFVPYEKFQQLWQQARRSSKVKKPPQAPVGSLIREMESEAEVAGDVVKVTAKIRIDLLKKGWHEVPLRLAGAAIRSAKVGKDSARVVHRPKTGYVAILEHTGNKPQQVELLVDYAKVFSKSPGRNSISFQAPQAPINRWQIVIPQGGVKVDVKPFLAAATAQPQPRTAPAADQTRVVAFVGAANNVQIDWTPKSEGATGLAAIATVVAEQQTVIHQGVVRSQAKLAYTISRAELKQLQIQVPLDQKVVNVFDTNVRKWGVKKTPQGQQIIIDLFEAANAAQSINVELERVQNNLTSAVAIPSFQALGVARQQGVVVVRLATGLRAELARRSGLIQLDQQELPPSLAKQPWAHTFRYATFPFQLELKVAKVTPRIRVDQLAEVFLEPKRISQENFFAFTIERAGVFQFQLDIPAGYTVRQVTGATSGAWKAASLDTDPYVLSGPNKTHLTVQLARRALGKVGVRVVLQRELNDRNLTELTGATSEIDLPVARVTAATVEQSKGRLVVHGRESLRVNPKQQDGVQSIPFKEARLNMPSQSTLKARGQFPRSRELFAFTFAQQVVKLSVDVERRKPLVTVSQLLVSDIQPGVLKHRFTFFYDIRFSGVKTLRIDVPKDLADKLRLETARIEKSVISPQPQDVAADYVAWHLRGGSELMDAQRIEMSWQQKIAELEVGKSQSVKLPVLKPVGVYRAWGQIVLKKTETLDVRAGEKPTGLRPIDPRHDLMRSTRISNAARAFEFHQDWNLTLKVTRYQLEDIKHSSIEQAVMRMVITPSKTTFVQAMYRMRSARQRLVMQLPEDVTFDAQPLRINGRVVSLEKGAGGKYFIPLVGISPDRPFAMELRYTLKSDSVLRYPEFPEDPAVQQVYLCVYLPKNRALLSASKPWVNEEANDYAEFLTGGLIVDDHDFVSLVSQGVRFSGSPPFPTSGRLHVFSTLNPTAEQSLRITTIHRNWLHTLIVGGFALLGIALYRQNTSLHVLCLALLGIAYVGSGVLMPTLTRQLTSPVTFMSVGAVAVLWASRAFMSAGSQVVQAITNRQTAAPATREETSTEDRVDEPPSESEDTDQEGDSGVVFVEKEKSPATDSDEQVVDVPEKADGSETADGETQDGGDSDE